MTLGITRTRLGLVALALIAPTQLWAAPPGANTLAPDEAPAYDAALAAADVELLLSAGGREYLAARARLEANPDLARAAVLKRLGALDDRVAKLKASGAWDSDSDAYGDVERERSRLVAVLAASASPEDIELLGQQLRRALLSGQPADPWRPLLLELGPAALTSFASLVGEKKLSAEVRMGLLDDMVSITPSDRFRGLAGQLGRGDRDLEHTLRRALVRRARASSADADALVSALAEQLEDEAAPSSNRAAALLVRARIDKDSSFSADASRWAADEAAPFELRIAALDVLSRTEVRGGPEVEAMAQRHLEPSRRREQRSEILAFMALNALPDARARALVDEHNLAQARAPRLAEFGWTRGSIDSAGAWLDKASQDPWPEVRMAALSRLGPKCSGPAQRKVSALAGPYSRGGDLDPRVARAAVSAIGRCGDLDRLYELLDDDGIGFEQRAVVARVLVELDSERASLVLAKRLRRELSPQLAERYADALSSSKSASSDVHAALCHVRDDIPTASEAARRSLRAVFPERGCN